MCVFLILVLFVLFSRQLQWVASSPLYVAMYCLNLGQIYPPNALSFRSSLAQERKQSYWQQSLLGVRRTRQACSSHLQIVILICFWTYISESVIVKLNQNINKHRDSNVRTCCACRWQPWWRGRRRRWRWWRRALWRPTYRVRVYKSWFRPGRIWICPCHQHQHFENIPGNQNTLKKCKETTNKIGNFCSKWVLKLPIDVFAAFQKLNRCDCQSSLSCW